MTGHEVRTRSGQGIGTVAAIEGDAFKVFTPEGEIWLNRNCIYGTEGRRVMLICDEAELPRHRVAQPTR